MRVEIGDKKITMIFLGILQVDTIFELAQIISDMQAAGWLDAGDEDRLHTIDNSRFAERKKAAVHLI